MQTMNLLLLVAVVEKGLHVSGVHGHISTIESADNEANNCTVEATVVTVSVYGKPYFWGCQVKPD
jgi:hypothetical protein